MARVVDGKIILGVQDSAVIATLADERARTAARKRANTTPPPEPATANLRSG